MIKQDWENFVRAFNEDKRTLTAVARDIGIGAGTLRSYITGTHKPSKESTLKIQAYIYRSLYHPKTNMF